MTEIKFRKGNIIISIVLCLLGISFFVYLLINEDTIIKVISVFWISIILYILSIRLRQLSIANKQTPGLEINDKGILNSTVSKALFISWKDIESFHSGFYKSAQIFIHPKDPEKYTDKSKLLQLIKSIFSPKSDVLTIDTDVLETGKKELLILLNNKLQENR
ncbi:STM3941 family protein [Chryseobacterium contaminans]|uniref:STM3941 family protein n=1 Tax=Chryseobacterium contaminans TaxID=1423959 RepID=UPI00301A2782